jgi:adenylylsulfate kinase
MENKGLVIWLTGLSGSGKTTVANGLHTVLKECRINSIVLDGDNIRNGINADLDFSAEGRKENIRRVMEIAKLFSDNGTVVIAAFISPYKADRDKAKSLIGQNHFREVYVSTSLAVCESRDTKGLYEKARKNEINDFTGISSPYEAPENPDMIIDTEQLSIEDSVHSLFLSIAPKLNEA